MIYVPLESVMSKYYGESERLLSEVFQASEVLGGCIIFLDEVDSLATTRGSDMHEVHLRAGALMGLTAGTCFECIEGDQPHPLISACTERASGGGISGDGGTLFADSSLLPATAPVTAPSLLYIRRRGAFWVSSFASWMGLTAASAA